VIEVFFTKTISSGTATTLLLPFTLTTKLWEYLVQIWNLYLDEKYF